MKLYFYSLDTYGYDPKNAYTLRNVKRKRDPRHTRLLI